MNAKKLNNSGAIWVYVVIGVAIILIVIGLVYYFRYQNTSNITSPIKNQITFVKSNNLTSAYNLTSDSFKSFTSESQFKEIINRNTLLKSYQSYRIEDSASNENNACVKIIFSGQNNSTLIIYYGLAKNNNQWQIEAIVINP